MAHSRDEDDVVRRHREHMTAVAMGEVRDAGRWLVRETDPARRHGLACVMLDRLVDAYVGAVGDDGELTPFEVASSTLMGVLRRRHAAQQGTLQTGVGDAAFASWLRTYADAFDHEAGGAPLDADADEDDAEADAAATLPVRH